MNAPEIVWEEPPPIRKKRGNKGKGRWYRFVAELKEHPGKWAIASEFVKPGEAAVMGNYLRRTHGLETTARTQDDGSGILYARWPEDAS